MPYVNPIFKFMQNNKPSVSAIVKIFRFTLVALTTFSMHFWHRRDMILKSLLHVSNIAKH